MVELLWSYFGDPVTNQTYHFVQFVTFFTICVKSLPFCDFYHNKGTSINIAGWQLSKKSEPVNENRFGSLNL